ncbi:MAG: hypothetical protein WCG93_12060 [Paludibacter sp.]
MTALGRLLQEQKAKELAKLETEYDEISNWLVDAPFKKGEWDNKIDRYNALSVKIATMNGNKIQQ